MDQQDWRTCPRFQRFYRMSWLNLSTNDLSNSKASVTGIVFGHELVNKIKISLQRVYSADNPSLLPSLHKL